MTRKRDVADAADDLAGEIGTDGGTELYVAYRTTEGWVDAEGEPLPPDATCVTWFGGVTMERAKAEANDYPILEEADIGEDGEYVTVPWDYDGLEPPYGGGR